ncbi:MAG: PTS sugar transporter subunit IIA [Longicatena sp.]
MLNERQYLIMDLLVKTNKSINTEDISKIVVKSKRTIMRDLSSIKLFLEANHIGELISSVERQGYRIKIDDEAKYEDYMKKSIRDEELILYELINEEYVTIERLSDLLYVSKITASEKMNVIKENYGDILHIEISHKGHHLKEPLYKKCVLVSNLIDQNTKYYLDKAEIDIHSYELLSSQIEHSSVINEYFPNVLPQQIANIFIAALLMQYVKDEDSNEDFKSLYTNSGIQPTRQAIYILNQISDHCIEMNLSLTDKQIQQALSMIEEENSIRFEEEELKNQLYLHLKRILCYSSYVRTKEIHNIANIKALYPFSFDLSILFINLMQKLYGYQIPNRDLIGLYFAVSMDKRKKKKHAIYVYSNMNSIASINKQLLEASLSNCEVMIVDHLDEQQVEDATLIINGTQETLAHVEQVYCTESILSDKDIVEIRNLIENISINKNIRSVFPKEYSFTYEVKEKEHWDEVIRNITQRLATSLVISSQEATRIIERERSGNSLIIGNYSIPHCISNKEDFCLSIYVHLSKPVFVESSTVSHVLITLMNPSMNNNLNIFKYLYRYLNNHEQELQNITSYEEFVQFI